MTGQELFEALSFVDERYIQEAEVARLRPGIPWRQLVTVAACLCVLVAGALAWEMSGYWGAKEEAAAPAATESMIEEAAPAATETAAAPKEDTTSEEHSYAEPTVEPATLPAELHHVSFAHLRILNVLEDGSFEVLVERVAEEPGPFDTGVKLTLVIDPEMIPDADRTGLPYDGDLKVDMLVEIKNGAYDAGINTLYVEGVVAAARE